jgi:serine/threonine-protein kinase
MSPEQVRGERPDPRSDVWSLGVSLYRRLTGHVPFRGSTRPEVRDAILHTAPLAPRRLEPGIDPDVEAIVLKAMQKSPSARHADAGELADDLDRCLRHR